MNELATDANTGYVQLTGNQALFTPERKVKILELAKEFIETYREFPSYDALARKVGISLRTLDHHLKFDDKFRHDWDEVLMILRDLYRNKLAIKADSKNGIVANLAILKYLETGSFVDRLQVNSSEPFAANKRLNDAIIIDIDPEVPQIGDNQANSPSKPA